MLHSPNPLHVVCVATALLPLAAWTPGSEGRRLYEPLPGLNLTSLILNRTIVNPNRELGPLARETNNFNLATLPCCRDSIGQLACQGLRKYQAAFFEKRCLTDHDFHISSCCMECRDYITANKIHPDNAKPLFKAPLVCKDKHSVAFCRKFKDRGIGKFSCNNPEFAMRTCRHSCGYCDDSLYDVAKSMPPCKV